MLEQLDWEQIDAGLKRCIAFAAEIAFNDETLEDDDIPAYICAQVALYASPLCGIEPPTDELMKLPEQIRTRIETFIISVLEDIEAAYTQEQERLKEQAKYPPSDAELNAAGFRFVTDIGKQLMELHVGYEQAQEYPLIWHWNPAIPKRWRVEKMVLSPDKTSLKINESLTLHGIPARCFEYRLGNRSALEWVIDQYQVTVDKRSGIVSDPNGWNDDEEYIVRLVAKVVFVSMETVRLQAILATIPIECFGAFGDMPSFFEASSQPSAQEEQAFAQPGTLWDV